MRRGRVKVVNVRLRDFGEMVLVRMLRGLEVVAVRLRRVLEMRGRFVRGVPDRAFVCVGALEELGLEGMRDLCQMISLLRLGLLDRE